MAYAFISYKREDEIRVGRIAAALERSGIEVWWDRGLPAGESWHANISAKLAGAGCVVVVWSTGSVAAGGHYVRDEARSGLERGVLVPVLIDDIGGLPLGFGEAQAIDLRRWTGGQRDPLFQDLVAAVQARLTGAPSPKPKGLQARVTRRISYGVASSAGLGVSIWLVLGSLGGASGICAAPGFQPGLSDACGSMGLGGRPTRAERLAWSAAAPGSCEALREHIVRFPRGVYRREAADLLAARRVTTEETWTPATRSLVLFAPPRGSPARSETRAKSDALTTARADADRLCRGFGAGTLFRFVSAKPRAETWSCHVSGGGVTCGFEGEADCALEARQLAERETCGTRR